MFGFLAPQHRIPEWRRSYARVCQVQRRMYGLRSLPFLSYEAVFLFQLAIDSGLCPPLELSSPECCRLRRLKPEPQSPRIAAQEFAASFGVLLAGIKLQDDVRDSRRWRSRLLERIYRTPTQAARRWLSERCPGLPERVDEVIHQHLLLENQAKGERPSLNAYCRPTSEGFATVYSALATEVLRAPAQTSTLLHRAGQAIGRAIICWDCAIDFEHDRIHGQFNPLNSPADVTAAFDDCQLQLAELGWSLPEHSICAYVLLDVIQRVELRRRQPVAQQCSRRMERWGLIREQGYSYAGCDGCEALCAVDACCECFGAAGEAAVCCNGPGCFCDPCCCCVPADCGGSASPKQEKSQNSETRNVRENVYDQYQGCPGIAETSLNPSGFVTINETRVPAKSETSQFIAAGSSVRVTQTTYFGVIVRAADVLSTD
ncbi:MAG: DUF5685 family protein [Planctomycetaceae bacterium]